MSKHTFIKQSSDPATPATNEVSIYVKDRGDGVITAHSIDDAGTVVNLGAAATSVSWRFFHALFNDSNTPWLRKSGASYATICKMVWPGTNNVTAPTKILANIFCQNGGASGSIRIRDITAGADICEVTGITTTTQDGWTDLGTLSNFSAGAAMWAVQIALNSGTGEMRCGAVTGY